MEGELDMVFCSKRRGTGVKNKKRGGMFDNRGSKTDIFFRFFILKFLTDLKVKNHI